MRLLSAAVSISAVMLAACSGELAPIPDPDPAPEQPQGSSAPSTSMESSPPISSVARPTKPADPVVRPWNCGAARIYWSEGASVLSANLDGSDVVTLVDGEYPLGVAVDPAAERLYWADNGKDSVTRSKGDRAQLIYQNEDRFSNPGGLAIDVGADRVFFTVGATVVSSRLDGSDPVTIATGEFPTAIAVDRTTKTVYWADNMTDAITRMGYDGSNAQEVYKSTDAFSNPTSIAIDAKHGRLYWAETGAVKASGLDGSNPVVIATAEYPTGVAIDDQHDALYFSDNMTDAITKTKLDGSSPSVVYRSGEAFSNPRHVFVVP